MDSNAKPDLARPNICDYEGSAYRTDFWTQERSYEDAVERIALGALLPPTGRRLVEIGAGFGRLVDLYAGYEHVILFDYSRSLLQEARARLGSVDPSGRPRYTYVLGDFYDLPFAVGVFDTVTMVRAIHHAQDVSRVMRGVNAILAPKGAFVLEFANKRNIKAIVRWLLRRQEWTPFCAEPYEFVDLNFDFHPTWMRARLQEAGFTLKATRSVSHFRLNGLKKTIPHNVLVSLDKYAQLTGRWWQLSPSVFVQSQVAGQRAAAPADALFRCLKCCSADLIETTTALICQRCQRRWSIYEGLYDFKS